MTRLLTLIEKLNLVGLSRRNKIKQSEEARVADRRKGKSRCDEYGKYLPNGQSAKSGLNKSWADAAFGQFFNILKFKAEKAGASVILVNPQYTSQLLPYKDEFVFTDCSIREYWDEEFKLLIDRDISAGINITLSWAGYVPNYKTV